MEPDIGGSGKTIVTDLAEFGKLIQGRGK